MTELRRGEKPNYMCEAVAVLLVDMHLEFFCFSRSLRRLLQQLIALRSVADATFDLELAVHVGSEPSLFHVTRVVRDII